MEASDDFEWVLPERGEGDDYRPETRGADYDAIVRDCLRRWMLETGRSAREVAITLDMEPRAMRAFLKGQPGTLHLASSLSAALGVSFHDVLAGHEAYPYESKTLDLKKAMIARLENSMSTEDVRATFEWVNTIRKHPDLMVIATGAFKMVWGYALERGYDVGAMRSALEQSVSQMRKPRKRKSERSSSS